MTNDEIFEDMLSLLKDPSCCDKSSEVLDLDLNWIMVDLKATRDYSKLPSFLGSNSECSIDKPKKKKKMELKKIVEAQRRAKNKELLEKCKVELNKFNLLDGIDQFRSNKSRYSVEKIHILRGLTTLVDNLSSTTK